MSILAWSNDFISGFTNIDTQHRTLFKMINNFAVENDESVSNDVLLDFLAGLAAYCESHFGLEEEMMLQNNYPLLEHHTANHKDLKETVGKIIGQIEANELKEPYMAIIRFTSDWLNNHIAHDDLAIFTFCKNKDNELNPSFAGSRCEISTMDNKFLGAGRIQAIDKSMVTISNEGNAKIPVALNDMVKVSSLSAAKEKQSFIAKVYYAETDTVKLFNATALKAESSTQSNLLVTTKLEGKLWLDDKAVPITIDNVSADGLAIQSDVTLEANEMVLIEFIVQNNLFIDLYKVTRVVNGAASPKNTYEIEFAFKKSFQSDKLSSFIFNQLSSTT